jgi:RimJ/RimL family protein N-acetyltransferase
VLPLTTDRLLLRDFEETDWPALHTFESLPEVARYHSFEPRTEAESRAYVAGAAASATDDPRRTYDLAVVLVAEQRLIGRVGLGLGDPTAADGVLSYTLHPAYGGQGYATEAARAVIDLGFRELRLHRIWAECDPANAPSWRLLERLGLRREGHLRENLWFKGAWADSLIYAVLDREWR